MFSFTRRSPMSLPRTTTLRPTQLSTSWLWIELFSIRNALLVSLISIVCTSQPEITKGSRGVPRPETTPLSLVNSPLRVMRMSSWRARASARAAPGASRTAEPKQSRANRRRASMAPPSFERSSEHVQVERDRGCQRERARGGKALSCGIVPADDQGRGDAEYAEREQPAASARRPLRGDDRNDQQHLERGRDQVGAVDVLGHPGHRTDRQTDRARGHPQRDDARVGRQTGLDDALRRAARDRDPPRELRDARHEHEGAGRRELGEVLARDAEMDARS